MRTSILLVLALLLLSAAPTQQFSLFGNGTDGSGSKAKQDGITCALYAYSLFQDVQDFLGKVSLSEPLNTEHVEKLLQGLDETLASCGITDSQIIAANAECLTTLSDSLYTHSADVYGRWKSGQKFEMQAMSVTNGILKSAEKCAPAYKTHI